MPAPRKVTVETSPPTQQGSSPSARLAVGSSFGRYRIEDLLGEGSNGTVYRARDASLDRLVALKIPKLDPGDPEVRSRFLREARTAAAIRHPNICPIHEVGEVDGMPYLAMAFIEGRLLSQLCNPERPVPPQLAATWVRQLASALGEAHAAGIIHRDLKPENIILDRRGDPIVMDFGLARSYLKGRNARMTQEGTILGSPAYMAPEQVRDDAAALGPASDIYALGVILFELLTGRIPFQGSVGVVLAKVLKEAPPDIRKLRPEVDERIDQICRKMMAKSPADRFRTMKEVSEALKAYLSEEDESPRQTARSVQTLKSERAGRSARGTDRAAVDRLDSAASPEKRRPGLMAGWSPRSIRWAAFLLVQIALFAVALVIWPRRPPDAPAPTAGDDPRLVVQSMPEHMSDFADPTPTPPGGDDQKGHIETNSNSLGMSFCWCPTGGFTMGSPPGEKGRGTDEGQVNVTLTGFWLAKYEVTQEQWTRVMGTGIEQQQKGTIDRLPPETGPEYPMSFVNYDDATQFCRKFTEQERSRGHLTSDWEYRLPTEAQWEYACRAGTTERFAAGEEESLLGAMAWYRSNAISRIHPIGEKEPNAWGLYDLHGNVAEICRDWRARPLPGGHDPDVTKASTGYRVVRGGSFMDDSSFLRSASRYGYSPSYRRVFIGFRVALVPPGKSQPRSATPAGEKAVP